MREPRCDISFPSDTMTVFVKQCAIALLIVSAVISAAVSLQGTSDRATIRINKVFKIPVDERFGPNKTKRLAYGPSWLDNGEYCSFLYEERQLPRTFATGTFTALETTREVACLDMSTGALASINECPEYLPYRSWTIIPKLILPGKNATVVLVGADRHTTVRYFAYFIQHTATSWNCSVRPVPIDDNYWTGGFEPTRLLYADDEKMYLWGRFFVPVNDPRFWLVFIFSGVGVQYPQQRPPFAFPIVHADTLENLLRRDLGSPEDMLYNNSLNRFIRFHYVKQAWKGTWVAEAYRLPDDDKNLIRDGPRWIFPIRNDPSRYYRYRGPKFSGRFANLYLSDDLRYAITRFRTEHWVPSFWKLTQGRAVLLASAEDTMRTVQQVGACPDPSFRDFQFGADSVSLFVFCGAGRDDARKSVTPRTGNRYVINLKLPP